MTELKTYFQALFGVGLCMAIVSMFFEWYTLHADSSEGEQVVFWEFQLFFGWITSFAPDAWFNTAYQPQNIPVPLVLNVLYIGLVMLSLYGGLVINLDNASQLQKGKKFGYIHLSTLLISGYYICIVPIYNFLSQELYFPYLTFTEPDFISIHYAIGVGYWLQCVAFGLIFPYTLYFALINTRFERAPEPVKQRISKILTTIQTPIDFHQLIAEERIELENPSSPRQGHKGDEFFDRYLHREERP